MANSPLKFDKIFDYHKSL